jgi:hypothetical protein
MDPAVQAVIRRQRELDAIAQEEEAIRQEEEAIKNKRKRILDAMFLIAQDFQVIPVYPSDTDDLEWRDPTPASDRVYPHSHEDYDPSVYFY